MNKHEAQLLLAACRPGALDADDPAMREALDTLRDDPELAAWFAHEQALDLALAAKLASVPVPDSLKADILAGAHMSLRGRSWLRSPAAWVSMAAAAVLMLAGAVFLLPSRPAPHNGGTAVATLGEYRSDVGAAFASLNAEGFKPTIGVASMADVAKFVSTQHSPVGNPQQPGGLAKVKPVACRVIDWRGQKVSIICVGREGLEAHVFVVNRQAIKDTGDVDLKAIATASGYPVVAWEDAGNAYVMVGNTKTTDLRQLL